MKKLIVEADSATSEILIGEDYRNVINYLPKDKVIVITDDNILKHYDLDFLNAPIVNMGLGEGNKTMKTLDSIFEQFLQHEVDRSWFVLAIGGGIVCDVAGFAASIYMRGLAFGFISTTLLSQVDASTGGKNGVNFQGYKNMIGVFNQPQFVICDTEMLKSLDKEQFVSGFAEVIKAGAIKSARLFEYLEEHAKDAINMSQDVLIELVYESVKIKAQVVKEDEREHGERKKLNLGHTFAHSFEKHLGILHGQAVSIGMVLAANLSVKLGILEPGKAKRLKDLVEAYTLPTSIDISLKDLVEGMKKDKKREGDLIKLILLEDIGQAVIKPFSINELEALTHDLHSNF